jgi:cell division protein FtsI/penicillin-binding protein 2
LPTTVKDGEARQAGIGQSETELTPIQDANLIATVANGVYKPVTLWANDPTPHPPGTRLPVSAEDWKTVREGLYDVVNVPQGTAYRTLQSKGISFGKYVMLGKTGSAEGWAPESIYLVRHPDGRREEIRALNAPSLLRKYPNVQIESQRRPPEYDQTHSWFVAYLAPRGRHLDPVGPGPASVAVAVIVEYAGHGGLIAAPVAAEILQSYLIMAERPAEPNQAGEGQ